MKKRIRNKAVWVQRNQTLAIAGAVALAIAFVFLLYIFRVNFFLEPICQDRQAGCSRNLFGSVESPTFRHPLTGGMIYENIDLPQVFGVMIDNNIDAWPQVGLESAFLVIEAPVEGGISRMLAFYYEGQEIEKIGPVRSARPYFVDWNNELDAMYVHVGGSNAALDLIASNGTFDFNQYWHGDDFWRSWDRYAPHNVFISSGSLFEALKHEQDSGRAPDPVLYGVWDFKDPDTQPEGTTGLSVDFYPPVYSVDWEFNQERNSYARLQYGNPHRMEGGVSTITADNIAVVITDVEIIDNIGRREIVTVGEGEAYVFQDGDVIEAVWKKPSISERLRFYDDDNEIIMNSGVTWIEVIPDRKRLTIND